MPLIHRIVGDLRGVPDRAMSPMGAALEELLGGERGSLTDLAARFRQCNLEHVFASWLRDAPHEPIVPDDLRRALGEARAEELATLAGLSSDDFLLHLARVLPGAVNRAAHEAETTAQRQG